VHRTIQRLACVHDLSVGMNPEALNRSTRQTDASLASGAISIALWQPMWNRGDGVRKRSPDRASAAFEDV